MNFHSMLVHFPIALLIIYSLFEIISFKFITRFQHWFYTKAIILVAGVLTAFPALSTGGLLEDLPKYDHKLVELHESFASASTNFYGFLAIIYILAVINRTKEIKDFLTSNKSLSAWWKKIIFIILEKCDLIIKSPLIFILAIIGILLLTITGGLGGVLSSGVGVDPIADFFYNLFF